ncbi:MAG: hypothetical protein IJW79_10465, partial [Clostridia bacterium]|nr:hypothetical protein [Clostridia bacterium]
TNTTSSAPIAQGTWTDFDITITPSTGEIKSTVNGTAIDFTSAEIKALYDGNMAFNFQLYYHVGMTATVHIDDVSISAKYKLDYTENDVLKTVTDSEGNTRGIFVIQDKEQYLTKQPFELSFDYMMNQKPSGYLNFVKMKMTGTSFAIFRLTTGGVVTNYTSAGYITYYQNKAADSGENLALNVASKTLTAGQWYNFRIVFDPNTGHVMGYIDNVLVCDYNINDVYIDANGTPLGITENPDRMYIELASQYSASAIKTNDSCFDNLRIRTLNYNEYTKTVLSDADFDSTASGALTANTFAKATGLYSKSLGGSFTVAGTDVAKYVDATVKAGEGIAIDMTNGYAPLATETVSLAGNFTFTAFGDGKMDIYNLKRNENEAVSLLSVDNSGKLFVGTSDMGYTLSLGTTYNIKLLFSGVAGTGELYVNGKFVGATDILTQSDIPALSYSDSMGNTVNVCNKKFLTSESETVKSLSGVKLQSAEMPDPFKTEFSEDTLNFLAVEGDGTWNVKFDDLSFKIDRYANIYSDDIGDSFSFADVNGRLWGNKFIAQFTYNSDSSEIVSLVDWKLGNSDVSLLKAGNGKLYAADGTTELAVLGSDADIAVAVNSEYWESHVAANNYPIDVIVYVDGTVVGSYNVTKSTATSSGALSFGEGVSDVKVYMGNAIRDNRAPADVGGAKFEGYNALFIDFEDEKFFETAEKNAINYVEWVYSVVGKTVTDWEGATVKLSEYVTDGDNSFFRIRRPELSGKPSAYMEYNLAAMGEYSALYSVELDMRYVDNVSSSMCIARLYSENMSGEINLLSVDYENRFYFINNGIRYYLCDVTGNDLVCNKPSDDSFTEVGLVINEAEGYYSIWINGRNAYYYGDGQSSGEVTRAGEIKLDYETNESYTLCDPKIRLFEGSDNAGSDCVADIDNVSIDVIKNGFAPVNYNYQVNELGDAVRFVATVDTLYTNSVGFEVSGVSNLESSKTYSDSRKIVFSSIIAGKDSENNNIVITAEELGGRYITVFSITDLPTADYTFTVRPFVEVFGKKIYGQETVYLFPES